VLKSYISLDVRILLPSRTKTFCSCCFGESCPVCRGEKGAVPKPQDEALRKAYLLLRGLGGTAEREAPYERLAGLLPAAFSESKADGEGRPVISGLSLLLGTGAHIDIMFHRKKKSVSVKEIRLEEDAGRLIRRKTAGGGKAAAREAAFDYSSAGMPSLRLRTGPDFEIGEETGLFLAELRRRVQYLELLGPGESPEQAIRCNAFVALAEYPAEPAYRVKLRNLNSFNFVQSAVNAELSRQEEILSSGGIIPSESRLWNEAKKETESWQNAAEKPAYEKAPEFAPFSPGPQILEALDNFTVELPGERRDRFVRSWGISPYQAAIICDEKSRADFFEQSLAAGAQPADAAPALSSWVLKELGARNIASSPLSPARFAALLDLQKRRLVNGGMARRILAAVLEEDKDPAAVVKERGWEQITDLHAIKALVHEAVESNPDEVKRIREGDAGPIRYLTGQVMKASGGLAEPELVKEALRGELSVSLVYVLSMGGAISGRLGQDGTIDMSNSAAQLKELLKGEEAGETGAAKVCFEQVEVGRILSEEIIPADWAALIETITDKLASGTANGIVVTYGTDTLPYTAALLYWLFADAPSPIVLASSSATPEISSEAERTIKKAVSLALAKKKGVYVVQGGRVLSPLNLKFERIGGDCFRNWNMARPVFEGTALVSDLIEADSYVLTQLLEDAANSMCVFRIYPGLRSDYLLTLMNRGVRYFFLELYDTGCAGFREGDYSLRKVLAEGKRRGVKFYCTSQQEGIVDFSDYASSRRLWKEGAVPMGAYTTETAVARFLAASIVADNEKERELLMESGGDFDTGEEDPSVFDSWGAV
jgi:aspartyl-tRNA(Asn)/glutamyl-tRNA(Gln) amidotransferase subunit B